MIQDDDFSPPSRKSILHTFRTGTPFSIPESVIRASTLSQLPPDARPKDYESVTELKLPSVTFAKITGYRVMKDSADTLHAVYSIAVMRKDSSETQNGVKG